MNCVSRERLSRQLFESRNKQCWLDVILQTYKCLVIRGIHEYKFWTLSHSSRRSTVYRESIVSSTSRFVIALYNFTVISLMSTFFSACRDNTNSTRELFRVSQICQAANSLPMTVARKRIFCWLGCDIITNNSACEIG